MRSIVIAAMRMVVAVTFGGCAMDSNEIGDEESPTAQVGEASTFTKEWSTTHVMRTRPIVASLGGTISVSSKADFDDHVGCPPFYTAELIHFVGSAEEVIGIARSYPLNQTHAEIWTALTGGTYRVQFSTTQKPAKCSLHGVVTVNVTP
jgi:hypothetical protein